MVSVLSSNAVDRGFIGGVMVSVLSSNAVDPGFKAPDKTKDYKLVFVASLLSTQH
jgi:hypothetical protein